MTSLHPIKKLNISPCSTADFEIINTHLNDFVKKKSLEKIFILEAGCGMRGKIKLASVECHLTGVDLNEEALSLRNSREADLDQSILGDLRSVELKESFFDVIYCSYVLEHVDGAEIVLNNFLKWLKPKGVIVIRVPDQETLWGYLAKTTPFFVHVFVKKYVQKKENAGKPGYDPFPTVYDDVVSRRGMYDYCGDKKIIIRDEYSYTVEPRRFFRKFNPFGLFSFLYVITGKLFFPKLAIDRADITYILEKEKDL